MDWVAEANGLVQTGGVVGVLLMACYVLFALYKAERDERRECQAFIRSMLKEHATLVESVKGEFTALRQALR